MTPAVMQHIIWPVYISSHLLAKQRPSCVRNKSDNMLLLRRPGVIPQTAAERDTVTGKLVETMPCHSLRLLLLLLWGHAVFLKRSPISPWSLGVLWWSLQVRFELSLSVKSTGALGVFCRLLFYWWWLWSADLEANIVDSFSDHPHYLVPLYHQIL